ncbi:hypothetical protein K445DRAFT_18917 [Daldinia sp. EC12]|nr:hypothetical protein K445DRAFT_18917 [Daldinia sp. EC12]
MIYLAFRLVTQGVAQRERAGFVQQTKNCDIANHTRPAEQSCPLESSPADPAQLAAASSACFRRAGFRQLNYRISFQHQSITAGPQSGPFATKSPRLDDRAWINTSHPHKGVILATYFDFFRGVWSPTSPSFHFLLRSSKITEVLARYSFVPNPIDVLYMKRSGMVRSPSSTYMTPIPTRLGGQACPSQQPAPHALKLATMQVCIRQLQSPISRWNLDPDLEMLIWPTAGDKARGSKSSHPGKSDPDDVHPGPPCGEITVLADKSMSVLSDISQHI